MNKGKFGGKDVKSGGRMTVKTAGASPKGAPKKSFGGGSRGEFGVQTGGTMPSGSPSKNFSNRSGGGEFAQVSAGNK